MSHYQSVHNPYGSRTALVDKMIGSAYDIVKFVAYRLDIISYVATHMDEITTLVRNLRKEHIILRPVILDSYNKMTVLLPDDLQVSQITSYSCMVQTVLDDLYGIESGAFTSRIVNGALELTVDPAAITALGTSFADATLKWVITYTEG